MAAAPSGSQPGSQPQPRVVIVGGGIIGASTAFYLSKHGVAATVVEREAPACAASGKAGGFLALDWNDSSALGPLARASYALHAELAAELGAERIGYRTLTTLQVMAAEAAPGSGSARRPRGGELLPRWVDGHVTAVGNLGGPDTTAQVHPKRLTEALLEAAATRGSVLLTGCVVGLRTEAAGEDGHRVTGVQLADGAVLPADAVVLAMGPWTAAAAAWLPEGTRLRSRLPPSRATKYHSVVLRPAAPVTAHALFTGFRTAAGRNVDPEFYPRPDGSVYVCGEPRELPVPGEGPAGVGVEAELAEAIRGVAGSLASCLKEAPVEAAQACYLPPAAADSLPLIGPLPGCTGAYLATGHTCWGILNGPATGRALAELIAEGRASSLDLAPFAPGR